MRKKLVIISFSSALYEIPVQGYQEYLNLKIDPKKIVMGLPWYGYDYPCLNLSQVE